MDVNAVSVPSAADFRRRWDVFLSFRGEDTRHNFTHDLYKSLDEQDVRVFFDDEGLRGGDEIQSGLFTAIKDSAASIAIISPNYASSHWCLEELSKICEYGRLLLPVFYRVNPSDVRRQSGPFEEHFRNHENTHKYKDKVMCWREAMGKAGGIVGWPFDKRLRLYFTWGSKRKIRVFLQPLKVFSSRGLFPSVFNLRPLMELETWVRAELGLLG